MNKKSLRRQNIRAGRQQNANTVSFSKLTLHKLDSLEWISIGIATWFFIYPKPYILLFSILLAIPIIGLLLNGIHKPSISTLVSITKDAEGKDEYDVADFIDIPAWVIFVRVLLDIEFDNLYSLIIPGAVACIITLTILFLTHKLIENSSRNKKWIYLSLVFNICLYSYAGTYGANSVYDFSEPTVYKAEVVDKRVYRGRKHTSYYLKVTPWGHHYDKEEIRVSGQQYSETAIGESVNIDLKKGLFNIPWYYIQRK